MSIWNVCQIGLKSSLEQVKLNFFFYYLSLYLLFLKQRCFAMWWCKIITCNTHIRKNVGVHTHARSRSRMHTHTCMHARLHTGATINTIKEQSSMLLHNSFYYLLHNSFYYRMYIHTQERRSTRSKSSQEHASKSRVTRKRSQELMIASFSSRAAWCPFFF